jgi:hypothetical protein
MRLFGLLKRRLIYENARNVKLHDSDRLLFVTSKLCIPVRNAVG